MEKLKYLLFLVAILLAACRGVTEPATSVPAASAPTATHTPTEPTATNSPEPTATTPSKPTATNTSVPRATPLPEPTSEATTELVNEHDEAEVEVISEPEFTGQAIQATWQKLEPTNDGPGSRYQHAMHYNAATNQVFVFGGQDGNQVYNEVWALDLATLT